MVVVGGGVLFPKTMIKNVNCRLIKGTNLAYDMLYETTCLDNREKEVYNLSGNRLINLKILTTNIEKILLC